MAEWIATSAADEAKSSLFGKVKEELSYIWNSTENVQKMKDEAEKLKIMRGAVGQQMRRAKRKGDDLTYGVQEWVDKVDADISKAEEFLVPDVNRYRYSKRAAIMVPSLVEHQVSGKGYESCVSVDTPAPGPLEVYQNKNLDDILTQNSALGDIITAIEDESKQIIGIYGLGGVGKTTLAMEVSARVNHLFAAVAFTTVSQTVSVEKIQKDIGDATKRIMKGEKILIILDDVWEKVELEKLCIPCGVNHPNCKILLTSRSEYVCEKMNAHKICVNALPKEEAWILFKRVVGDEVERDADLKQVAIKVAEECGGLPLFLNAVGNALKRKTIEDWENALHRLQEHAPARVDEEIEKAFTRLKLSYDLLRSDEAKLCFLLCSMFEEDRKIYLEDLVLYAVGLAKFPDLKSMEDARRRVEAAVKILTSFGLLLKLDDKEHTKMHDVVRDVALLIASEGDGKNKFWVETRKGLTEWLPRKNDLESYTGISLMKNKIRKLPNYELHLPHLDIFLIQENNKFPMMFSGFTKQNDKFPIFSDELIRGMKEVRVLDMSWCEDQPLPQSFKFLTKLRMLNLSGNKSLHDISILAEMQDLEILILDNTGIKEIPQEIGQLVNLRQLRAMRCTDLNHVAPGVISKLRWLEELLIGFRWVREGIYERIVEIMNLSNLTYMALHVPRFDVIPEGFKPRKLKGVFIQIGGSLNNFYSAANLKRPHLVIKTDYVEIPFLKWLKQLTEESHSTELNSIKNLTNILPQLYHEGFNELEYVKLDVCPNVSCLVDTANWDQFHSSKHLGEGKIKDKLFGKLKHLSLGNLYCLEVLWKSVRLSNLVTLQIEQCNKLVKVFPVSVAQGLFNLQNLDISYCDSLEEVIWDGDEETSKSENSEYIVFPCQD